MGMRLAVLLLVSTVAGSELSGLTAPPTPALTQGGRRGIASWYSELDDSVGRWTANGEVFDDSKSTCASWHFPFGTYVQVTNMQNGKSVICRVNDRGPRKSLNRAIDLTKSSFAKLADPRFGLIEVMIVPMHWEVSEQRDVQSGVKTSTNSSESNLGWVRRFELPTS